MEALKQHRYFLVHVNLHCSNGLTKFYHWITVIDSVVYDSLLTEVTVIDKYVSDIDEMYYLALKPEDKK
jgi:hypothetical protein